MIAQKKIFITGGAGFIASLLIANLVENNNIVIYDNFFRDTLSKSKHANHPNITVVKGNVLDYENVLKHIQEADIVVHAAAIAGIDTVIKSPTSTMRTNMIGTANVLDAAKAANVPDRIISFSTSEVFGSYAFRSSENDNTVTGSAGEARWTYAVSKLAAEHLCTAYHREFSLPTVSIRPFNVYGPGQMGEGAMRIFIKKALKNEEISIYGDGTAIRSWCYIDDFIKGLLCCIENPKAIGESFNIGNSRAVITVYGLAQTICRVLNSKSKISFHPPLSADVELRIPNVQKAKDLLDFTAKIDLEEGIEKTAKWYAEND